MLIHNNPKINSIFILSFWAFSLTFFIVLHLFPEPDKNSMPPSYLDTIPTIMLSIMGGYLFLFLAFAFYDLLSEQKLDKSRKMNLINYGIISFATLGMVLVDLIDIMVIGTGYLGHVYSGNELPLWQQYFLHVLFPTVCLGIVLLTSKYMKIEFVKKH